MWSSAETQWMQGCKEHIVALYTPHCRATAPPLLGSSSTGPLRTHYKRPARSPSLQPTMMRCLDHGASSPSWMG